MTSDHHPGRRTHASSSATRTHRTGAPTGGDAWFDGDDVPLAPRRAALASPRDPFLTRLGIIVLAGILLAPVVASMKNDDVPVASTTSGAAVAIVAPAGATASSDESTPSPDADPSADDASAGSASSADDTTSSSTAATGSRRERAQRSGASAPSTAPSATAASPTASTAAPTTASTAAPATTAAQPGPIARPTPTTAPACALTYDANAGDFWIGIADRAGVELRDLLMANQATVNTPLYPGDEICLPAGARNPGPPPTVAPTTTQPPATTSPTTKPPTTQPPTTTPPTTKPPTTQPPSTGTYTREQVIAIIRDVWPDELEEKAILIATRESNLIPTARNFCCHGLFQMYWNVHRSWLAGIGITSVEQLYNPRLNAIAAYTLYQRAGGWGPWSMTAY